MRTNRIEALTDGIFAIVMTLLILELHIPNIHANLLTQLYNLLPKFISFIISFIILGIFWIGHQNQYAFIKKVDRVFLWINILFFMFVGLVPFSAGLLGEFPQEKISIFIYGLNLTFVGMMMYLHWWYAVKKLIEVELKPEFIKQVNKRILIGPLCYLVALPVSFFSPYLSIFLFILPVIIQVLPGRIDRFLK